MSATWAWVRLDTRRRLRSLVVLALLIAVSGATVLTAVAGARRGQTALERLTAVTLPATVQVTSVQPGFDWAAVGEMPEVETVATYADVEFRIVGVPAENLSAGNPPGDDRLMRTVERPVVLTGRLADPDRPDEAVVTAAFVTTYGVGVGDTVTAALMTPAEASGSEAIVGPLPSGPRVPLTIVGVVRSPWLGDGPLSYGSLWPTPGLLREYRPNLVNDSSWFNGLVRLHGGEAAVPAFRESLAEVAGRSGIIVENLAEQVRHRQRAAAFEAQWLLAFAGAAALAALLLVGQALTRHVTAGLAHARTLNALGMTRRQVVLAASAGPALASAAGAVVAVTVAAVASRWFPIGSAAADEPAPGVDVDVVVLGVGLLIVVALVTAAAAGTAWLAVTPAGREAGVHPSPVATAAAGARLPVPVVLGVRFALEKGRGTTAVAVRPALLGAAVGVLGVVAAFTFSAGLAEAARNPDRFGTTWDLESFLGFAGQDFVPAEVLEAVAADADVVAVNDLRAGVADVAGSESLLVYTYASPVRPVDVVLRSGRMPGGAGEVVLAPGSARTSRVDVGDTVALTGSTGEVREMTVSGIGFVPAGSHCTGCSHALGAWVTDDGFDALFETFQFHIGLVELAPEADPLEVARRLQPLAPDIGGQALLAPPYPPSAIADLRQVRPFPVALGVFLSLLAVAAVGHAMVTAVHRRRRDVAVLRALGMTPRQTRVAVVTQATVLAVVGLVVGVPLGVAVGRTLWRTVAEHTPLQYVPPFAAVPLLLVVPVTLVLVNLLGAWPGHRAVGLRPAQVLRAE